jgi:tetratricopeptide (TPR) repeat protein
MALKTIICLISVAGLLSSSARAQKPTVESVLDGSFRLMYNLQFDEALRIVEQAKTLDAADPLPWVAQACAVLFREFDRLHILRSEAFASDEAFSSRPAYSWVPEHKKQFDDATAGGEKIAQKRLAGNKNDAKALFTLALVSGLRGDDNAMITKHNLKALSYIKTATGYSEKLLVISPEYYDAYVGTGLAKYIIGAKSAPVRWVLRLGGIQGDQDAGLKELTLAAQRGRFLAPFARIVLAFDEIKKNKKDEALKKLALLHEQYPSNSLFVEEMAKMRSSASSVRPIRQ